MSFFIWKESFNTHIPVIDRQHQRIFGVLNRLYDATQAPVDHNYVMQSLREMNDYSNLHFSTEERLMAHYGYPEIETQKEQHVYYREQMLAQLTRAFHENDKTVCKNNLEFLRDWFLNHILQEDLKFAEAVARENERTRRS
jgi:hemerythrin